MSNKNKGSKKVNLSTITTIKLLEETKLRIEKLREHKRESYDDILRKILYVLNVVREEPEKSKKILERIDELRRHMFEEEEKQKENLEAEMKNGDFGKEEGANTGKEIKSEVKINASKEEKNFASLQDSKIKNKPAKFFEKGDAEKLVESTPVVRKIRRVRRVIRVRRRR